MTSCELEDRECDRPVLDMDWRLLRVVSTGAGLPSSTFARWSSLRSTGSSRVRGV